MCRNVPGLIACQTLLIADPSLGEDNVKAISIKAHSCRSGEKMIFMMHQPESVEMG